MPQLTCLYVRCVDSNIIHDFPSVTHFDVGKQTLRVEFLGGPTYPRKTQVTTFSLANVVYWREEYQ